MRCLILVAVVQMTVLAATIQGPSADQSYVKVSGKGSAFDTPDVASFTITVQ